MTKRLATFALALLLASAGALGCDRGGSTAGGGAEPGAGNASGAGEQAANTPQAPEHPGTQPFVNLCASCHGNDGTPTGAGRAVGAPSLRTARVHGLPAEDIMRLVHEGRGNMRPIQVDDATLADIIGYVRTLSEP